MNYYECAYYRGEQLQEKSYTFASKDDFKVGDIVELPGHKKGAVTGISEADVVKRIGKIHIKEIAGKWKEDE